MLDPEGYLWVYTWNLLGMFLALWFSVQCTCTLKSMGPGVTGRLRGYIQRPVDEWQIQGQVSILYKAIQGIKRRPLS